MKREIRDIRYDTALQIEAHLFHGKIQPFPNHFHDYYVIGIVEEGNRRLICRGCRYEIEKGDILFFCSRRQSLLRSPFRSAALPQSEYRQRENGKSHAAGSPETGSFRIAIPL